ncbi:MAG TPA: glycosyltransferase 87 family protein [Burkholderiales bacterium]|nr:glycosyltransferase 87 family protein [Burkholderiales bacterium]
MSRGERVAVFVLPALLCAAWTVFAGKDVNWDLLNYHYYLPYEWLHDRVLQDYFAASGQGYLNPVGFVPFYVLAAGWHSVVASMALAAMHSVNLALLYLIAWRLFAHRDPGERRLLCLLAAVVGGASAIFWATVGSSFLEPLLAVPMLAGVLLLIEPGRAHPLAAGLLFGVASALKYSNAIFALAALPLALAASPRRWRAGLAYVAGGVAAVAIIGGPWLVMMWREFGNPVFPLFNAWFKSPHAPQANMFAGRFAIADIGAALAFPFELVAPGPLLYAEITAPDLRFAALVIAAAAALIVTSLGLRRPVGALTGVDWRLLGFFALAFALWFATSVNGRYGLIVLLLAGVCLVRITERLLPISGVRVALAVLLVAQITACVMVAAPRWFIADRWSASWLPFQPDERARREPALYLTVETLPMAAVVPFVHPQSSFANVRGQYSIAPGSPALLPLFERHAGHVRALGRFLQLRDDGRPRPEVVEAYDSTLIRFGYRVDGVDCFAIPWRPDEDDWLSRTANWLAREPARHDAVLSLGSCGLVPAKRDPRDIERERSVSAAFDRIEQRCAKLLGGQSALIEPFGKEWMRNYPAIDARLLTDGDRILLDRYLALSYVDFGPLSAWERGEAPVPDACKLR